MKFEGKPILTLDFDNTIMDNVSGWKGPTVIDDPIIPGAIEFIIRAMNHFQVAIHSSRSHQWGGRRAMKRFLKREFIRIGMPLDGYDLSYRKNPVWVYIGEYAFADPWPDEVEYAADRFIRAIKWPIFKPPSFMTIDDRARQFTGVWPEIEIIKGFRPWNKMEDC
jgi:hypothetical protein